MTTAEFVARVRSQLDRGGLLLMQDSRFPSLVSIVAQEVVGASWWSHPKNKLIYDVLQVISSETLVIKLLDGKRTFVHRRLWGAVCALGESNEDWQLDKLRKDALDLLTRVRAEKVLRTDRIGPQGGRKIAAIASDLEKRLLVHSSDEHTEAGHHARVLETWERWRKRAKVTRKEMPGPEDARRVLTDAVCRWASSEEAVQMLPWV